MTYVIEVTDGLEVRVCEVTSLYDKFSRLTNDPAVAVSGVLCLGPRQYLDFDPSTVELFTVH